MRPDHLFLGTPRDNYRDMLAKGRHGPRASGDSGRPRATLTAADVRHIRRLAADGVSARYMAKMYGVYPTTIRDVVSGESWGWVA